MSHIIEQKSTVKLTSLELLGAAAGKLGGKLEREQKTATYYCGQKTACDAAIVFPGTSYEIGVVKAADGSYALKMDLYDGTLRKAVSSDLTGSYTEAKADKLFQRYRVEELHAQARRAGHRQLQERVLPNGKIQLQYAAS